MSQVFSRILCPVDFSPCSRLTLHYARQLAEACRGQLVLLHVKPTIVEAYQSMVPELAAYVSWDERSLSETFNDFSGDWSGRYEKIISGGTPHEEILRIADQMESNVIVMGAKGLSRVERFLLGGTTEKVVRRANCPVLTVHDGDPHLPAERILFPTDLSDYAKKIWPLVAGLAQLFHAKVHIAHILDLKHAPEKRRRDEPLRNFVQQLETSVQQQITLGLETSGIDHEIIVQEHPHGAAAGLMELAEARRIDLIIMPAHGKHAMLPPFIGGITERVVRLAHCPVLTARYVP